MSDDMSARMIPEPEEQAVQAEPDEGDKLVRPPYNRKNATLTPGPNGNSEREKIEPIQQRRVDYTTVVIVKRIREVSRRSHTNRMCSEACTA